MTDHIVLTENLKPLTENEIEFIKVYQNYMTKYDLVTGKKRLSNIKFLDAIKTIGNLGKALNALASGSENPKILALLVDAREKQTHVIQVYRARMAN